MIGWAKSDRHGGTTRLHHITFPQNHESHKTDKPTRVERVLSTPATMGRSWPSSSRAPSRKGRALPRGRPRVMTASPAEKQQQKEGTGCGVWSWRGRVISGGMGRGEKPTVRSW